MSKWNNFNDAEDQMSYELIPHKTIARSGYYLKKATTLQKSGQTAMLLRVNRLLAYILPVSL